MSTLSCCRRPGKVLIDPLGMRPTSEARPTSARVATARQPLSSDSCRCNALPSPLHRLAVKASRAMKIGIIGAGQIGATLTRRFTALGHEVFVANSRGPETLSDLAAETGATAVLVPEAVRGVDLIVVTIPEKNIPSLPAGLFAGTPDHVVVVDTGNYYPRQRDGRIEEIEAGLTESQWVAQQLGRPVIKAFNNIYARHLLELGRGSPGVSPRPA